MSINTWLKILLKKILFLLKWVDIIWKYDNDWYIKAKCVFEKKIKCFQSAIVYQYQYQLLLSMFVANKLILPKCEQIFHYYLFRMKSIYHHHWICEGKIISMTNLNNNNKKKTKLWIYNNNIENDIFFCLKKNQCQWLIHQT